MPAGEDQQLTVEYVCSHALHILPTVLSAPQFVVQDAEWQVERAPILLTCPVCVGWEPKSPGIRHAEVTRDDGLVLARWPAV